MNKARNVVLILAGLLVLSTALMPWPWKRGAQIIITVDDAGRITGIDNRTRFQATVNVVIGETKTTNQKEK